MSIRLLASLAASFCVAAVAQADRCDITPALDRIWDQPHCPGGVCHTLLLRSDGSYQVGLIAIGPKTSFCESGRWQLEPGRCGMLRLEPCSGPARSRSWTLAGPSFSFGESRYRLGSDQKEFTAFSYCTVRRRCDGLSCGEYLGCLRDCSNDVIPTSDCPARCAARAAPGQAETARLRTCAQRSACRDDSCMERACAAELRACAAR